MRGLNLSKGFCRVLLLGPGLGLGVFCGARAEAAPGKDLFEMTLEELLQVEVVTASGTAESSALAPASMTVFNRDDLQRMGIRWLDELMAYVPGGQGHHRSGNSVHFWVPMLRGSPDIIGTGIMLLRNGARETSAYITPFNSKQRVSLADVERVEILRGPGAAIYGANALYGVVNLITHRAPEQISVGIGEFSARTLDLRKRWHTGEVGISTALNYYHDEGADFQGIFDRNQRQTSTTDPQEKIDAELAVSFGAWNLQALQRESRTDNYYSLTQVNEPGNNVLNRERRWTLEARQLQVAAATLAFSAVSSEIESDFSVLVAARGSAPPYALADSIAQLDLAVRSDLVNLQLNWPQGGNQWSGGLEWEQIGATLNGQSNYDFLTQAYLGGLRPIAYELLPNAGREFYGLYAQWQRTWAEGYAATLALRRDAYDDIGGATSPRLALSYEGFARQIWKLLYSEAFRAPTLQELHLANNPRLLGNPELAPVRLSSRELSWSYAGDVAALELALYQTDERDRIVFMPVSPLQSRRENAGRLQTTGLEWSLRWRPFEAWQFALLGRHIFSWQEDLAGAVQEDRTADLLPRDLLTVSADWQRGEWGVHGAVNYVDEVAVVDDSAPYYLARLALNYRLTDRSHLSLSISNLTDQEYVQPTDPIGFGQDNTGQPVRDAPQRGRQALLSWGYRW